MADEQSKTEQLALPSVSDTTDTNADQSQHSTVKLDQLGPAVVNSDGTLSRIQNWENMTTAERERTLKVLGKRNMLRQKKLEEQNAQPAS